MDTTDVRPPTRTDRGVIVVFGATGRVGQGAVAELVTRGASVRAVSRDPVRAAQLLPSSADVAYGDFADASSVRAVAQGADSVLVLSPHHPLQSAHQRLVVHAAVEAGVRRIVKVSSLPASVSPRSPSPVGLLHHRTETEIRGTGIPWTFVRPAPFMQNLVDYLDSAVRFRRLLLPLGRAPQAMVHAADVGAVCAAALLDWSTENHRLTVTGPEALRLDEVAPALSRIAGRPLSYRPVAPWVAGVIQRRRGVEPWLVQHQLGLGRLIASGEAAHVTNTVEELTGRPARSFADFLDGHAAVAA
jgi:uncharacterized protein YbjT (DUF2867 family)